VINSLNRFAISAARKPLWVFGWAVFGTAFWFTLDFYVSLNTRLAELGRHRATIAKQVMELRRIGRVNDSFLAALIANQPVSRFYKDHLANLVLSEHIPEDLLQAGARMAAEARSSIATAVGTIDGIEFADGQLGRYAVGLKSILQGIDKSNAIFAEFFRAYSSKGPRVAIRELRAARTWIFTDTADAVAAFTRLRSWHETVSGASDALLADLHALQAASQSIAGRSWISGLAVAYCVAFLWFAVHSWQRHSSYKDTGKFRERSERL